MIYSSFTLEIIGRSVLFIAPPLWPLRGPAQPASEPHWLDVADFTWRLHDSQKGTKELLNDWEWGNFMWFFHGDCGSFPHSLRLAPDWNLSEKNRWMTFGSPFWPNRMSSRDANQCQWIRCNRRMITDIVTVLHGSQDATTCHDHLMPTWIACGEKIFNVSIWCCKWCIFCKMAEHCDCDDAKKGAY